MKPARIILLAVALLAGGLAAILVMRGGTPQVETQTIVTEVTTPEAKVQILVAKAAIGVGERLTADAVQWQDWPEGAVQPEYVSIAAMPDAPLKLTGAVARFEFFPGEPIREAKLVRTDQGYLSAVLGKGMRGVSVPVTPESGSGGFIVPNDHVDVLVTRSSATGGQTTEVALHNVRVLAIGKRLGELGVSGGQTVETTTPDGGPQAQTFDADTIATLELDPNQAQTVVNAKAAGVLSLSLLSIADFNDAVTQVSNNQTVRLIRFGRESNVMSSSTAGTSLVAAPLPAVAQPVPTIPTQIQAAPIAPVVVPR